MSSYNREWLRRRVFEEQYRYSLRPMTSQDESSFITRESVRQAMSRRNEPAVWHTTGLNPNDIRPEDYIIDNLPRSVTSESDNEELRTLREWMDNNIQNQRNQHRYTINDYMADFPFSISTELEKLTKNMRDGEFKLEPKPSKKTLSNPRLSLEEGTDDV